MTNLGIGRLERVALREVWRHEAYDFTRWLQDNIDVLNSVLALNLLNVEREQAAGAFSIDLVAEDEDGGKIIIENQLERSNHDHLGKLLTYLVAMNARAAVWIVSDPRPEHVATIAWMNDSSSADFYLVKVEAVRIGESPPAPLLTLIVGPSAESKAVSRTNRDFAERHELRRQWWTQLLARPEATLHRHISARQSNSIATTSSVPGLGLGYVIRQESWWVELYIAGAGRTGADNKAIFDQLLAHRDSIEASFGEPLEWQRLDGQIACRIRFASPGGYRSPPEDWDGIQEKQIAAMNRLNAALQPYLRTLRTARPLDAV